MGWVGLGKFVNLLTHPHLTQLVVKNILANRPNPTHKPLKTDPTHMVGLNWVSFEGLMGWLYTPNLIPLSLSLSLSHIVGISYVC